MQLKADVTIKQNNIQSYTAVGIVLPPSSACGLQTLLLELGERQEHSTGRAEEGRKARFGCQSTLCLACRD